MMLRKLLERFRRAAPLCPLIPGVWEATDLCSELWPDEIDDVLRQPRPRLRTWLNEKTGLNVPGDVTTFYHWLPRLRELAAAEAGGMRRDGKIITAELEKAA